MKTRFLLSLLFPFFFSTIFAEEQRSISVVGRGSVDLPPDFAVLRLGVSTSAKTAKFATEQNNQSISRIFSLLRELGVSDDDFETVRFSLNPQRQYRKDLPPIVTGYQASNVIRVEIHDLEKVGEIMQAAIDAGGNNFESLSFAAEKPELRLQDARVRAVEDALGKAEVLARTLGARVGPPLSIQEIEGSSPPVHERRMMHASDAMMSSVPVQGPSELSFGVEVRVKFSLETDL